MTTNELLKTAISVTQNNIDKANQLVKDLKEEQILWRPSEGTWNVQEILAHMNEFARFYHPTFTKKIEVTRFTSTKEAFISSPLGKSAWKSMKLGRVNNVKRKFKAAKGNNPLNHPSIIFGDELDRFVKHQNRLLEIIEEASKVNMRRVKIPISISKIIRLRLGDALLFVVYHNERHVQQISNLTNNKNFPKS